MAERIEKRITEKCLAELAMISPSGVYDDDYTGACVLLEQLRGESRSCGGFDFAAEDSNRARWRVGVAGFRERRNYPHKHMTVRRTACLLTVCCRYTPNRGQ